LYFPYGCLQAIWQKNKIWNKELLSVANASKLFAPHYSSFLVQYSLFVFPVNPLLSDCIALPDQTIRVKMLRMKNHHMQPGGSVRRLFMRHLGQFVNYIKQISGINFPGNKLSFYTDSYSDQRSLYSDGKIPNSSLNASLNDFELLNPVWYWISFMV